MKGRKAIWVVLYSIALHMIVSTAAAHGREIVLLPIYYEQQQADNQKFVPGTYERDITEDIRNGLKRYYNVWVDNAPLLSSAGLPSISDARRIAASPHINEVIFGKVSMYNTGDSKSLVAELHIYTKQNDRSKKIAAVHFSNEYDQFINTVIKHILEHYNTDVNADKVDVLRSEVSELRAEIAAAKARAKKGPKEQAEPDKEFALRVPLAVGYWSYVQPVWVEMVQGTVEVTTGIQMYPEMQFPALFDMKNELSLGLRIGYRNGVTNNKDTVSMNGILINPAVGYHVNLYTNNWLCIGTGVFYELGMWNIEDHTHKEEHRYRQSLTGYSIMLDYAYRINRLFTVNFGVDLYGYFTRSSSPVIRTYFGTVLTVLGGTNGK